jgi:hypothetical protein
MKRIIAFIFRYCYSFVSCLYLFTVGILSWKNRSFLYVINKRFGYTEKWMLPEVIIPEAKLAEIVAENVPIKICEPVRATGNITLLELVVIINLVKLHNPSKLFEIGTFDGRTTLNMACNSSEEAKVYTLDLPKDRVDSAGLPIELREKEFIEKEKSGTRYIGTDYEAKIVQLYGDSATFDFSPFFNTIDFIFIDGAHSHEYVLNDSKAALKLLRDGKGVILWHDYGDQFTGVRSALNELYLTNDVFKGLKHIKETSLAYLAID